ncbi:MAG: PAS domain S-box protein [Cyanobacteria bacterium J007]|nr:MAG: PAS domain S-box protein [Cyanobacteria bacterium J007]
MQNSNPKIDKSSEHLIGFSASVESIQANADSRCSCREQFCRFVRSLPIPAALLDEQMSYLAVSRSWTRDLYLRESGDEGDPTRDDEEDLPDFGAQWQEMYKSCLESGQEQCEMIPDPHDEETTDWVRWQMQPWFDERGNVRGVVVYREVLNPGMGDRCALPSFRDNANAAYSSLLRLYKELDKRFQERNRQLQQTNSRLHDEIRAHEQDQIALRRHAQMLDLANDTIMILDLNYRIVYWNHGAERLYKWTRTEALSQPVHDFLKTEFPYPPEQIKRTLLDRGYWQGELVHSKRDGSRIVVESRWTLQYDDDGNPSAILEINHDISDRKDAEAALRESEARLREKNRQLKHTLEELKNTQAQLIQTEKMSSLGQLVAGVAHEINNPVNFIYGNLNHTKQYMEDLLKTIELYQKYYPEPIAEIEELADDIDLYFILKDLPKMLASMQVGAERIREIVRSLRNFSRSDRAECQVVDLHEGIENTLLLLKHRFKSKGNSCKIEIIKEYGKLPLVECYAGQMNQVFMNILGNAIDALEELAESDSERHSFKIWIRTQMLDDNRVEIRIGDNAGGIDEKTKNKLFDPFFTTKPPGKGTGLGLAISYQIVVERHGGQLECISEQGKGTEFVISIPPYPQD